jgi:hypothetical protein
MGAFFQLEIVSMVYPITTKSLCNKSATGSSEFVRFFGRTRKLVIISNLIIKARDLKPLITLLKTIIWKM